MGLRINPAVLTEIATQKGWVHERGRLRGTINASQMAAGLGVAKSTITRAYDYGAGGFLLLDRLRIASGMPLDQILEHVDDEVAA